MAWDIVAVVAAGASAFLFVVGIAWDFKFRAVTIEDVHWRDKPTRDLLQEGVLPKVELGPDDTVPSVLQSAVDRRGRHLRTD